MSTAVMPRRRGRRPRLKVVGGVARPRHRSSWNVNGCQRFAVEFWTEAEWWEMAPAERPEKVSWLRGIGFLTLSEIDQETCDEIGEELRAAAELYDFLRGKGG